MRVNLLLLSAVLILQSAFSGCGYLSLTRKTKFEPKTEDVLLTIAESEDGPYRRIKDKNYQIKLNHWKKNYWVKQERNGFVSQTIEITRTAPNHLKRVDILSMVSLDITMTIMAGLKIQSIVGNTAPQPAPDPVLYTAIAAGLGGWAATMPAPGKLYPRKIELPELLPILKRDTGQLWLVANETEFRLKKKGVRVRDYQSKDKYSKGYGYDTRDTAENFEFVEEIKLYNQLVDQLNELEFNLDTSKASNTNCLRLDNQLTSVVFNIADNKINCELKSAWALETNDQLQYIYDKSFSTTSEWVEFNESDLERSKQEEAITAAFDDAVGLALKRFVALDTVQSILNNPAPIPLAEEEELILNTGDKHASSVAEVVKAVFTIVTTEGHGSGCLITPDGYIVTNAHVVDDDTTGLEAILNEDVDKRFPLKFIRMNEAVDLALLKLDTTGLVPVKLGKNVPTETGSDVYAVGTPADIELGQSVTRGIISGKRKFGGHAFIQTDVAINPGNSGGALIKKDGTVLGIVTAELKNRQIDDIGFAIPAKTIESALKIKVQ